MSDLIESTILGIQDKEIPVYLIPAGFVGELEVPVDADITVKDETTTATFSLDDVYGVMLLPKIAVVWVTHCAVREGLGVTQRSWTPPEGRIDELLQPKDEVDVDFLERDRDFWRDEYVKITTIGGKQNKVDEQDWVHSYDKDGKPLF